MIYIIICMAIALISTLTSVVVCVRVGKLKNGNGNIQVSHEFQNIQSQINSNNKMLMDSLNSTLINTNNTINNILLNQRQELDSVKKNLSDFADRNEGRIAKLTQEVNLNMNAIRQENARQMSDYLNNTQNAIVSISSLQKQELENIQHRVDALTLKNEEKIEKLTQDITLSMNAIRQENEKQLDAMRVTVDEKLNISLSQRLNDSFAKIQSSLEHVDTGLGEMKALATGTCRVKVTTSNGKYAFCTVTVLPAPDEIGVENADILLGVVEPNGVVKGIIGVDTALCTSARYFIGSGNTVKLVNQVIVASTLSGLTAPCNRTLTSMMSKKSTRPME